MGGFVLLIVNDEQSGSRLPHHTEANIGRNQMKAAVVLNQCLHELVRRKGIAGSEPDQVQAKAAPRSGSVIEVVAKIEQKLLPNPETARRYPIVQMPVIETAPVMADAAKERRARIGGIMHAELVP